jgi:hypothetical protein
MVKFLEVSPDEIENFQAGRRGRISYPILKGFLETGMFISKLDLTGVTQSKMSLAASFSTYINGHNLPIKMFQRSGNIYLMRLDIDKDGNEIADWAEDRLSKHVQDNQERGASAEINSEEITKQYPGAKDTTK